MNYDVRLAAERDLYLVLPLVGAYHEFEHVESSESDRETAVRTLLSHAAFGGIWLIYAGKELVGYVALCRGYSIEFKGTDAFVGELYVRPEFRGRGAGSWALKAIK